MPVCHHMELDSNLTNLICGSHKTTKHSPTLVAAKLLCLFIAHIPSEYFWAPFLDFTQHVVLHTLQKFLEYGWQVFARACAASIFFVLPNVENIVKFVACKTDCFWWASPNSRCSHLRWYFLWAHSWSISANWVARIPFENIGLIKSIIDMSTPDLFVRKAGK